MTEDLPCPYGDGSFPTVGTLLRHVAGHLTDDAAEDSPTAQLVTTWQGSTAARTTSGQASEILMRLLAMGLQNHAVAADAVAVTMTLQGLAGQYEAALASSVEDRTALRATLDQLQADLTAATERIAALETPTGGQE